MADPIYVPIRERIGRRVQEICNGIKETGTTVHRWDMRDSAMGLGHLDMVVRILGETADEEAGGHPLVMKTMRLAVNIVLQQPESDTEPTEALSNRWLADIEEAVMGADPLVGDTERLVVQSSVTEVTGLVSSEKQPGQVQAAVIFAVDYQHNRTDPYTGPGITKLLD